MKEKIPTETLVKLRELGLPQPESPSGEGKYVFLPNTSGKGTSISHGVYHPSLSELIDFVTDKVPNIQIIFRAIVGDEKVFACQIVSKNREPEWITDNLENSLALAIISLL